MSEVSHILSNMSESSVAVFDEAQFFSPKIVKIWSKAAKSGINIYASSPSAGQLLRLKTVKHKLREFTVICAACSVEKARDVVYKNDLVYPTHLCIKCKNNHMQKEIKELLNEVRESQPFPNEFHTYQPFYDVDMSEFELVRGDSQARLNIILEAVSRVDSVQELINNSGDQPTFLDLGCCSGFFADGMNHHGFRTTGVDVGAHFIDWAQRLATIKGQAITYEKQDAYQYLKQLNSSFDVASTFATIQWVMAQNDYDKGVECYKMFFDKVKHLAIVEMGYNTEEIYKDRIKGAPVIDKEWVRKIMEDFGGFEKIEFHPSGENGIWRDVFVGFKNDPNSETKGSIKTPKTSKSFKLKLRNALKKLS